MKLLKTLDVKTPSRGTPESAGIDFFVPNFTEEFIQALREIPMNRLNIVKPSDGERYIEIPPHCRILIPAGIKYSIPPGTALVAMNKSGIASKRGLIVGAQVGDSDYQGVFHINVINTTSHWNRINEGEKIIQCLLLPIIIEDVEICNTEQELFSNRKTLRGEGGFGSTGTH